MRVLVLLLLFCLGMPTHTRSLSVNGTMGMDEELNQAFNAFKRKVQNSVSRKRPLTHRRNVGPIHYTTDESDLSEDEDLPFMSKACFAQPLKMAGKKVIVDKEIEQDVDVSVDDKNTIHVRKREVKKDELILCDKTILVFTGKDDTQVKTDVQNSMSLAQLNANHKLKKEKEVKKDMTMIDQMKVYSDVLKDTLMHMKWISVSEMVDQTEMTVKDLSMDKILLQVVFLNPV